MLLAACGDVGGAYSRVCRVPFPPVPCFDAQSTNHQACGRTVGADLEIVFSTMDGHTPYNPFL